MRVVGSGGVETILKDRKLSDGRHRYPERDLDVAPRVLMGNECAQNSNVIFQHNRCVESASHLC